MSKKQPEFYSTDRGVPMCGMGKCSYYRQGSCTLSEEITPLVCIPGVEQLHVITERQSDMAVLASTLINFVMNDCNKDGREKLNGVIRLLRMDVNEDLPVYSKD